MITTPNQFTLNGNQYYVVGFMPMDGRYIWRLWAVRYRWLAVVLRKRLDILIAWSDWTGRRLYKRGRVDQGGILPKTTVFYWFAIATNWIHDKVLDRFGIEIDEDEVRRLAIN